MSVVDKLRAFRYTTAEASATGAGSRELPWKAVRAVNVAAMKTEEPDLHLMKNLLSLLSSFTVTSSAVRVASDTDLLQLIQLMQVSLQFALHSQNVLKQQLVERQNLEAVRQVSSKYVERMEAKVAVLTADSDALQREHDTLKLSAEALRRSLAQQEAKTATLERQLELQREHLYATVTRQEKLLQLTTPVITPPPLSTAAPAAAPLPVDLDGHTCPTCGRLLDSGAGPCGKRTTEEKGRPQRRGHHRAPSESDTTTTTSQTELSASCTDNDSVFLDECKALGLLPPWARGTRRHNHRRSSASRERSKYVDWETFLRFAESVRRQSGPPAEKQRALDSRSGGGDGASSGAGVRPPKQEDAHQVSEHLSSTEEVRALLSSALEDVKDGIKKQLLEVQSSAAATAERLSGDLAHLRSSQAQLEVQLKQSAAAPPSSSTPVTVRLSGSGGANSSSERDPPAAPAGAEVGPLSRQRQKQQRQESVTPLEPSLPLSSVEPPVALAKSAAAKSTMVPPESSSSASPHPSSAAAAAPETAVVAPPSQPPRAPSAQRALVPTSNTSATLTSGVSADEQQVKRAPPSLKSSSLTAKSRSSLPDFDISMLRTPPKAAKAHQLGSAEAGRQSPAAGSSSAASPAAVQTSSSSAKVAAGLRPDDGVAVVVAASSKESAGKADSVVGASSTERDAAASPGVASTPAAGSSSVGGYSLDGRQWHDTPSEEQPASATVRALMAAAAPPWAVSPGSTSASLPFLPHSRSPSVSAANDSTAAVSCQHCHATFPAAELRQHETSCEMRVIPCATCGQQVAVRLMPRHECSFNAEKTPSKHNSLYTTLAPVDAAPPVRDSLEHSRASSLNASLGPQRSSSVMLQETQQELQRLLDEEEEFQRSRNSRPATSDA